MGQKRDRENRVAAEEPPAKRSQNSLRIQSERARERPFWQSHFRAGLYDDAYVVGKAEDYRKSKPYKHAVIDGLVEDELLRNVRKEVLSEIHYTQKETDIYKIHQSGDLANLDGLDEKALGRLPHLLKLRNALYSPVFREFLEEVTGCGKLSGSKTDMAINIYTPGSHLLCHDDVIGSRRISYILYLTDPDNPWKQKYGGALRLYPTKTVKNAKNEKTHIPMPDFSEVIYPAWNQLSFFAVQPGLSFHDVGEVFEDKEASEFRQPMRVAISGWFHIPQEGEDGYIEGEAEALQKQSSLTTLQSSDAKFDYPAPKPKPYPEYNPATPKEVFLPRKMRNIQQVQEDEQKEQAMLKRKAMYDMHQAGQEDPDFDLLTTEEADFLIPFINPAFLAPDQAEEMHESFNDKGHIVIEKFLRPQFAAALEEYISKHNPDRVKGSAEEIESQYCWKVAKPPHKHKYLVMTEDSSTPNPSHLSLIYVGTPPQNHVKQLITTLFNSLAFRKWLQIVTGLVFKSHDLRVRRFRRGSDYQLAKLYNENQGRVELTLGLTPAGKWEAPVDDDDDEEEEVTDIAGKQKKRAHDDSEGNPAKRRKTGGENGKVARTENGSGSDFDGTSNPFPRPRKLGPYKDIITFEPLSTAPASELTNNGGYEMFIRGDEDEDDDLPGDADKKANKPGHAHLDVTGKQRKKADPAVYQTAGDDEEDDGILLNTSAGFNRLSIVLRDSGTMRFVKYVSERAGADRWDLAGEWEVDWERSGRVHGWDESGDEGEGDEGEDDEEEEQDDEDDEDEWAGFPDAVDPEEGE